MDAKQALEIKNIITGLLISTPLRMTLCQLLRDYREIEGRNIPFKELGFPNVEAYLRSIPETIMVYGSGPLAEVEAVITSKTEHINTMVLKQKKSKPPSRKGYHYQTKKFTPLSKFLKKSSFSKNYPVTKIETTSATNNGQRSPEVKTEYNVQNNNTLDNTTKVDFLSEKSTPSTKSSFGLNDNCDAKKENCNSNYPPKKINFIESQINEKHDVETSIHSSEITSREIIYKASDESHSSLEISPMSSLVDELEKLDLSNDDHVEKKENISWNEENFSSRVLLHVQKNLKKFIEHFPHGIECTKLPAEYRKMFKKGLHYEEYGYRSLIEMCSDLPNIFSYVQLTSHEYMLYDKTKPIPILNQNISLNKRVQSETTAKSHILEELPKLDRVALSKLIPPDVVNINDEISRLFPSDVVVGDLLEIDVGEIYDLSKFWIYMTFGKLDQLMKDLQDFFLTNHKRYQIHETLLEEGLYCVALYGGQYHRCVIVDLMHKIPQFVRVFFIDYGTVSNVHKDEIWFLPKQFGQLPSQAIRARLSNIYPPYENRPWCADAVARFTQLTSDAAVVAEVTKVDEQDHVLEVYLADITNKDNIFYINDVFVKEGYALYTDEERKRTHLIDLDCIPNVRYIHLYPEFYEIETGRAPTQDEMMYINENKIPLSHFMPQYFDIHYYEDINGVQLQHEKFNQTAKMETTITPMEPKEFDLDFFPDCLKSEMRELYEQENADKVKPSSDSESEANKSVKEYFCNKKRISELIYGNSSKTEASESKICCDSADLSSSLDQIQDIVPLNNSLPKCSPSSNDTFRRNPFTPRPSTSTNPFHSDIVGSSGGNTNPFRSTNPFLSDIEQTVNNSDFLDLFAKSSQVTSPRKIVNNLKDTHTCKCKMSKQVNVDSPVQNHSDNSECSSSFVSNISHSPQLPAIDTARRVRTPPGFSSLSSQNVSPTGVNFNTNPMWVPNFAPNLYYNVPYAYYGANRNFTPDMYFPLGPPFLNNYYNYISQFQPKAYNPNTNWQKFYNPQGSSGNMRHPK